MLEQHKSHARPRSITEYARLFLTGCAMGAADLVPGVSGGTMAFVLGVYQDLLDGIRSFNLNALRLALRLRLRELEQQIPLRFLLALGLGMVTAALSLAGLLSATLADPTGRVYLFAFFFGLVSASIVAVGAQLRRSALARCCCCSAHWSPSGSSIWCRPAPCRLRSTSFWRAWSPSAP